MEVFQAIPLETSMSDAMTSVAEYEWAKEPCVHPEAFYLVDYECDRSDDQVVGDRTLDRSHDDDHHSTGFEQIPCPNRENEE